MSCPNKSHPDYIKLVEAYGEGRALAVWERNNETTPTVEEADKLLNITFYQLPEAPARTKDEFSKELVNTILNQFSSKSVVKAGVANALKVINRDTSAQKKIIAINIADEINKKYGKCFNSTRNVGKR